MIRFIILVMLCVGCSVETESAAPEICPPCAWSEPEGGVCGGEYRSTRHFESLDDGASACWIYDTTCAEPAASVECAAACGRTFVTCQPVGGARVGGP